MDRPAIHPLFTRVSALLLPAAVCSALFLSGCHRAEPPVVEAVSPLQTELDEARARLVAAGNILDTKDHELAAAKDATEAIRTQLSERDLVVGQRDAQIKTAQAELEAMKKRDAFVFADISAELQQGRSVAASIRYQQFLKDFPSSPLAIYATRALAELKETAEIESVPRPNLSDPKVRAREFTNQFEDGTLTLKELAPTLKKRSISQVLGLLGPPNRIFGDGTEIGYVDKVIDPVTSKRGMFIVAFESGVVANLRVEYAGRRLVP